MTYPLRPELIALPAPERMAGLPRDARGWIVPWFVEQLADGSYDFRVASEYKRVVAVRHGLCWLCGQPLGKYRAFVLGPMCAINRTTSEPPCHRDCAAWAVQVCPFLSRPHARRRTDNVPDGVEQPGGLHLDRNPGVMLVWITTRFGTFKVKSSDAPGAVDGWLLTIGDPSTVLAYAEGRPATRDELWTSIATGLPSLVDVAVLEGGAALDALRHQVAIALAELAYLNLVVPSTIVAARDVINARADALKKG